MSDLIKDNKPKECVHTQLFKAQEVMVDLGEEAENEILSSTGKVDFTEDSEYKRMFEQHTDAMLQQSELIEHWVKQEEKRRPPPLAAISPFGN